MLSSFLKEGNKLSVMSKRQMTHLVLLHNSQAESTSRNNANIFRIVGKKYLKLKKR